MGLGARMGKTTWLKVTDFRDLGNALAGIMAAILR